LGSHILAGVTLITATSDSLLAGLSDTSDQTAWQAYVERYRPLLWRYGRRFGLGAAEAEDFCQDTLLAFAEGYRAGRYDRARGRLRSWLFGIARNVALKHLQRTPLEGAERSRWLERAAGEDPFAALWEKEWRLAVLRACLGEIEREVEPQTFRAFCLFAREGRAAAEVAAELDMTENAVFCARQRIVRRVRELLPSVEAVF